MYDTISFNLAVRKVQFIKLSSERYRKKPFTRKFILNQGIVKNREKKIDDKRHYSKLSVRAGNLLKKLLRTEGNLLRNLGCRSIYNPATKATTLNGVT